MNSHLRKNDEEFEAHCTVMLDYQQPLNTTPFRRPLFLLFNMQNIPTEDIVNELERRVDCSKRRGVRTILIGKFAFIPSL